MGLANFVKHLEIQYETFFAKLLTGSQASFSGRLSPMQACVRGWSEKEALSASRLFLKSLFLKSRDLVLFTSLVDEQARDSQQEQQQRL